MKRHLAIFFVIALIVAPTVHAADLTVTCTASNCDLTPENAPLFEESNVLPLNTYTQTMTIENEEEVDLVFTFRINDVTFSDPNSPNLGSVVLISIENADTNTLIITDVPLANLSGQTIDLGSIPAEQSTPFLVTATMQNVGNPYQLSEVIFDIDFTIDGLPEVAAATNNPIMKAIQSPDTPIMTIPSVLGASELPVTGQGIMTFLWWMLVLSIGLALRRKLKNQEQTTNVHNS